MRNIIITGGNSGLGFKTAEKIASVSEEYRVIIASRNMSKSNEAKEDIIAASGNKNVVAMELDTSSLASVRQFAVNYKKTGYGKIYALLCNAGISASHTGMTEDGFDVIFETNHLGHFLLTSLLFPCMEDDGMIFVTSSDMHDFPRGKMRWNGTEKLAHPNCFSAHSFKRYSYSKLCNLYFIYELAERLQKRGSHIRANAFNPGLMQTNFMSLNKASLAFVKITMPQRYGDLEKSSTAYARLVTEDGLVQTSGQYYDRSIHSIRSSALSYNEKTAENSGERAADMRVLETETIVKKHNKSLLSEK